MDVNLGRTDIQRRTRSTIRSVRFVVKWVQFDFITIPNITTNHTVPKGVIRKIYHGDLDSKVYNPNKSKKPKFLPTNILQNGDLIWLNTLAIKNSNGMEIRFSTKKVIVNVCSYGVSVSSHHVTIYPSHAMRWIDACYIWNHYERYSRLSPRKDIHCNVCSY